MVKRFRKQFSEVNEGGGELDGRGTKSGQLYSQELREEIGRYAGIHGVQATVQAEYPMGFPGLFGMGSFIINRRMLNCTVSMITDCFDLLFGFSFFGINFKLVKLSVLNI